MKKAFLSLFTLLLMIGTLSAQESPSKALKAAKSALDKYNLESDDAKKKEKIQLALEKINIAIAGADQFDEKDLPKMWLQAGDIHYEMVQKDINLRVVNPEQPIEYPESAIESYKAYEKALQTASKKYHTSDAIEGLQNVSTSLAMLGNGYLNDKEYEKAFNALKGILDIHEISKGAGKTVVLSTDEEMNDHLFVVAFTAMITDRKDEAKKYFQKLIDAGYDDARIYSNYASIVMETDEKEAMAILAKGREKYPNDTEILFGEINYYIQKQEFEQLKTKLAEAMEKAPDNPSVPSALGNVYMNLFQKEDKAGNAEKAEEYFNESKKYYNKAIEIDPTMYEAVYSIGSLWYNKAVAVAQKMNALGNTKAELKQYDELAVLMKEYFNEALPHFKKAEKMNPNDANTLIALKEIYARNDDFNTSNEFKKRLETVQAGGKVESSYFK